MINTKDPFKPIWRYYCTGCDKDVDLDYCSSSQDGEITYSHCCNCQVDREELEPWNNPWNYDSPEIGDVEKLLRLYNIKVLMALNILIKLLTLIERFCEFCKWLSPYIEPIKNWLKAKIDEKSNKVLPVEDKGAEHGDTNL